MLAVARCGRAVRLGRERRAVGRVGGLGELGGGARVARDGARVWRRAAPAAAAAGSAAGRALRRAAVEAALPASVARAAAPRRLRVGGRRLPRRRHRLRRRQRCLLRQGET